MKRAVFLALLVALLGLAMATKGLLVETPRAPARGADGFDTGRALARLERILGPEEPHPVDSDANDRVRDSLVAELRAAGLAPVVTDGMACNGEATDRTIACARIRNVLVTVGPAEGRHLLMVAHYDSTPVGPGAADDGMGIAALIETAALLRRAPLKRPVTFLFNEGEETGLIGARAFLDRNPLAARVDSLVNLEARGVNGPAIMFETSRPNGEALAHFARAAERPVANSLTTDFYRLVPNRTDVTVLNERRWTTLNLAVIGNETRYHSPGDNLAGLDRDSLGHMGAQALALARSFAAEEPPAASGDRLYADILGRFFVQIPLWAGIALLWALLAGFAVLAWRRREGVLRSAGVILLVIADAALTVWVLQALIGLLRSGEWWRAHPWMISAAVDITALASAAVALLWLTAGAARERMRIAFWLVYLAFGALLSLAAPGAAIFFLLPPLLAALGLILPRGGRILALLAWAALFVTWAPLLHLSQVLLDFDAAWVFAPVAALLLIPAVIEAAPLLRQAPRGAVTGALLAAALLAWLPAALAPAYSEDRKQRMSIEYLWDEAEGKARWLVYHDRADLPPALKAAAGPFEKGFEPPWSSWKRWSAPAAGPRVLPPAIEPISERRTAEGRLTTFRLRANGAETIRLRAEPEAAWRAIRAGDAVRRFGSGKPKEDFLFRCHGRSCDGLEVELLSGAPAPVEVKVIGMRSGLPDAARPLVQARPAQAEAQYGPDASYSVATIRL